MKPDPQGSAPQGVDVEQGLLRCAGNQSLYQRVVARFLATRSADASNLRAALAAGDRPRLFEIAHAVTSTAGTLGAAGLSAAADALQLAAQDGASVDDLSRLVDDFAREHGRVLVDLEDFSRGNPST